MELLVNIDVPDLEQAERFYRHALGLRPGRRIAESALEMLGAQAPIWLLARNAQSQAVPGAAQQRSYLRHWTPVHLDFVVDDMDITLHAALAAGARQEQPVTDHAWGRLALLADPFGHGFCLIQFIGRGYDEVATPRTPASPSRP